MIIEKEREKHVLANLTQEERRNMTINGELKLVRAPDLTLI